MLAQQGRLFAQDVVLDIMESLLGLVRQLLRALLVLLRKRHLILEQHNALLVLLVDIMYQHQIVLFVMMENIQLLMELPPQLFVLLVLRELLLAMELLHVKVALLVHIQQQEFVYHVLQENIMG